MASRVVACVGAVVLVGTGLVGAVATSAQAATSCTDMFDPTSGAYVGAVAGSYTCTVPASVTSYDVVMRGGYGGSGRRAWGGLGAKLTGSLSVTPNSDLTVDVAANGTFTQDQPGGAKGSSGGGYSAVGASSAPLLVAGGGGGDGNGSGAGKFGGAGGAGTPGSSVGGNGDTDDEYAQGGMGADNGTGGAGGLSQDGFGPGGAGGNLAVNGSNAPGGEQPDGGGGGGGYGGSGGSSSGGCSVAVVPGGAPGGGSACNGGGGGGGYGGGGGGGGLNAGGRGAGGGGGSSYFPNGFTAVATAINDVDKDPRVEFTEAMGVTNVSPNTGSEGGGTRITILGTRFDNTASVTVGGVACSDLQFISETELACTTGAHVPGAVDVVVTTLGGSVTLTDGYTYLPQPVPTLTSIAPATGPTSGGTRVTLTGTDLTGATVTIGGATCTSLAVSEDGTTATCLTPAGAKGAADVVVTTTDGTTMKLTGGFTYTGGVVPANHVPNKPRDPNVIGKATAKKFVVKWTAPTMTNDGRPVVAYRVTVDQIGVKNRILTRMLKSSKTKLVLPRKFLLSKSYRTRGDVITHLGYKVKIVALNSKGAGPIARTSFFLKIR